jgi:hypothetical protein
MPILKRIILIDFFVQEEGKAWKPEEMSTHLKRKTTSLR